MRVEKQSPLISMEISGVPAGARGLIHVVGRNDSSIPQEMGISWIVEDPDGITIENYQDWAGIFGAATDVDPGKTHEFIGDRFDINKAGTWTIAIGLFMNSAAPVQVDSYNGVLVVVEQLAGSIVKKELEYDSTRGDIPVQ